MRFNYPAPTAFMGATTLVLLLSGFRGISYNSLTTPHLVYSGLGASPETITWLNIPLPPPPEDPKPAGSRDGLLCLITPAGTTASVSKVWSTTPTFVWAEKFLDPGIRGSVDRVAVVLSDSQTVVWSQPVTAGDALATTTPSPWRLEQLAYTDEALQPGQTYQWVVLNRRNQPLASESFQVMALAEQQAISEELIALEEAMTDKGATVEEIAVEKAFYFTEQHLWSDARQVVFAVKDPSQFLVELQSQLSDQICDGA